MIWLSTSGIRSLRHIPCPICISGYAQPSADIRSLSHPRCAYYPPRIQNMHSFPPTCAPYGIPAAHIIHSPDIAIAAIQNFLRLLSTHLPEKSLKKGTSPSLKRTLVCCECSRSVATVQTWNSDWPWRGFRRGRVCQVCQNLAVLEQ